MLKVPNVSISKTVLKPLAVSFSAEAKKLPAAPLTRMSSLCYSSKTALTAA
jgi:hypothetical protein